MKCFILIGPPRRTKTCGGALTNSRRQTNRLPTRMRPHNGRAPTAAYLWAAISDSSSRDGLGSAGSIQSAAAPLAWNCFSGSPESLVSKIPDDMALEPRRDDAIQRARASRLSPLARVTFSEQAKGPNAGPLGAPYYLDGRPSLSSSSLLARRLKRTRNNNNSQPTGWATHNEDEDENNNKSRRCVCSLAPSPSERRRLSLDPCRLASVWPCRLGSGSG